MSRNLKTLALLFSVVLNATLIASYTWPELYGQRFAYEEVDLAAHQRARFEAGRNEFLRLVNRIGSGIIEKNVQLIDLIAADAADENAIQAQLAEIRSDVDSMQQAVVKHLMEDKRILDPGQQKQFFDVLKARIRAQGTPGPPWIPRQARSREE
jgi:Spy/CpxP family protein refolding chaperone